MKISVIIPTYNEGLVIGATIDQVHVLSSKDHIEEILVVDGGSNDDTRKVAMDKGARVLQSDKKGRGAQLDFGARHAKADLLYFLHADSVPPEGFDREMLSRVSEYSEAGCFQMRFDRNDLIFRIYGWFTKFSWIFCRGGDQSLFITRALYTELKGFNTNYTIFEDIDIIERIRKTTHFSIIPKYVTTSARRYEENGFYRLQFYFAVLHLKYRLGTPPEQLLQYYQKHVR